MPVLLLVKLQKMFHVKAWIHGRRRTLDLGGGVNFLPELSNRAGEQAEKVVRISYCSFREFAPVKRISA